MNTQNFIKKWNHKYIQGLYADYYKDFRIWFKDEMKDLGYEVRFNKINNNVWHEVRLHTVTGVIRNKSNKKKYEFKYEIPEYINLESIERLNIMYLTRGRETIEVPVLKVYGTIKSGNF